MPPLQGLEIFWERKPRAALLRRLPWAGLLQALGLSLLWTHFESRTHACQQSAVWEIRRSACRCVRTGGAGRVRDCSPRNVFLPSGSLWQRPPMINLDSAKFLMTAGRNALRFSIRNRSILQTAARLFKLCDIVCSPSPLFPDQKYQSHPRARGEWGFLANLRTFCSACWWNLRHLAESLAARHREREREKNPAG